MNHNKQQHWKKRKKKKQQQATTKTTTEPSSTVSFIHVTKTKTNVIKSPPPLHVNNGEQKELLHFTKPPFSPRRFKQRLSIANHGFRIRVRIRRVRDLQLGPG